jgi:hypothetical protein
MTEEKKLLTTWDAETAHPEICEKIRGALRDVRDPELGMDVIQLGLIRNVIMESARKKAEEITGMPTEITYGTDVWNQTMMEEGSGFDWGIF